MTSYKARYDKLASAAQAFLVAYQRGANTDGVLLDRLKAALLEPVKVVYSSAPLTPEQIEQAKAADAAFTKRDIKRRVRRLMTSGGKVGRYALEGMCADFGYVYETVAEMYQDRLIDD